MSQRPTRTMRTWRKFHRYSFGYSKWLSLITVVVMIVISVTGILLVHQDDFRFMQQSRVPVTILPEQYDDRLVETRAKQGTRDIFTEKDTVPLRWVVLDLHTGEFFGKLGPLYYDIIAVVFMTLASTGIYMYFKIRRSKAL